MMEDRPIFIEDEQAGEFDIPMRGVLRKCCPICATHVDVIIERERPVKNGIICQNESYIHYVRAQVHKVIKLVKTEEDV